MKIAIISNVNVLVSIINKEFTNGPKTIRKIIQQEIIESGDSIINIVDDYLGEPYVPDATITQPIIETAENITWCENTLRKYIYEHVGAEPVVRQSTTDIADLLEGALFLVRESETKYYLNIIVAENVRAYLFSSAAVLRARPIGKYYSLEVAQDYDVESPRILELSNLIRTVISEKTEVLAESCALRSELNNTEAENTVLRNILEKFQREVETVNARYDIQDKKMDEMMAMLNTRRPITRKAVATPIMSLPDELLNFDKKRLRSVVMTQSTF